MALGTSFVSSLPIGELSTRLTRLCLTNAHLPALAALRTRVVPSALTSHLDFLPSASFLSSFIVALAAVSSSRRHQNPHANPCACLLLGLPSPALCHPPFLPCRPPARRIRRHTPPPIHRFRRRHRILRRLLRVLRVGGIGNRQSLRISR